MPTPNKGESVQSIVTDGNTQGNLSSGVGMSDFLAIRVQTSGTYRLETLSGIQYVVVPVVALVEGVIQGITAAQPELALASEFGKFPMAWNGRPITIDHPHVVENGEKYQVSANTNPDIADRFQVGFIFNSKLKDDKLVMEAWIDPVKANNHSEAGKDLLQRIRKGEVVEVSTGLFTNSVSEQGYHEGEQYFAVWKGVVPDHLALLPTGLTGACSVADGCGANVTVNSNVQRMNTKPVKANSCSCGGATTQNSGVPSAQTPPEAAFSSERFLQGLVSNAVPSDMLHDDARSMLQDCLDSSDSNGSSYPYVVGVTNDTVVYSAYDSAGSGSRKTYQAPYSIDPNSGVAKIDSAVPPQEVNLTTKITPKTMEGSPATNQAASADGTHVNKETTMTQEVKSGTTPAAPEVVAAAAAPAAPAASPVVANTQAAPAPAPVVAAAAPTFEQLLASAPAGVRESIEAGMRMHTAHKAGLVAKIKANGRNKFSEDQLNGFDVGMLENLAELANVPTFEGVAPHQPRANSAPADDANSAFAAPPPRLGLVAKA